MFQQYQGRVSQQFCFYIMSSCFKYSKSTNEQALRLNKSLKSRGLLEIKCVVSHHSKKSIYGFPNLTYDLGILPWNRYEESQESCSIVLMKHLTMFCFISNQILVHFLFKNSQKVERCYTGSTVIRHGSSGTCLRSLSEAIQWRVNPWQHEKFVRNFGLLLLLLLLL